MNPKPMYLDPAQVTDKVQGDCPPNPYRSGYGPKIPTSWRLKLTDGTWRRVYVMCWSNSGSAYVRTKQGLLFLGGYEP